jgi:hypothetical protein
MEEADGYRIMNTRNGREIRPAEIPKYSVDGYCPNQNNLNVLCFTKGIPGNGSEMSTRYERMMSLIKQIKQARYQVIIQWECEFDNGGIVYHPIV